MQPEVASQGSMPQSVSPLHYTVRGCFHLRESMLPSSALCACNRQLSPKEGAAVLRPSASQSLLLFTGEQATVLRPSACMDLGQIKDLGQTVRGKISQRNSKKPREKIWAVGPSPPLALLGVLPITGITVAGEVMEPRCERMNRSAWHHGTTSPESQQIMAATDDADRATVFATAIVLRCAQLPASSQLLHIQRHRLGPHVFQLDSSSRQCVAGSRLCEDPPLALASLKGGPPLQLSYADPFTADARVSRIRADAPVLWNAAAQQRGSFKARREGRSARNEGARIGVHLNKREPRSPLEALTSRDRAHLNSTSRKGFPERSHPKGWFTAPVQDISKYARGNCLRKRQEMFAPGTLYPNQMSFSMQLRVGSPLEALANRSRRTTPAKPGGRQFMTMAPPYTTGFYAAHSHAA
ncbi:hypothetical protein GGX14DRAFT_386843 [Mycena pura]|uniref:Uncharacterized protein n=1 Tax=Mycena pura TaxID=153505 RepID=A0AAD6YMJ1_9AGAR|nr:hypothetical protein GGX14DRAFT_386843 [Mycena pura]